MARGRVVRKSSFAAGTERGLINIRWRAVIAGGYIYVYFVEKCRGGNVAFFYC